MQNIHSRQGHPGGLRTLRPEYAAAPLSWRKLSLLSSHSATLTGNELVCLGPQLSLLFQHYEEWRVAGLTA